MLRHPTTDHALFINDNMAKKEPYTISKSFNGTILLNVAGLTEVFKAKDTVESFALDLANAISERRNGMFHLQDTSDGKLQMIMQKTGNIITFKDYDQASMFADKLFIDLQNKEL